MALRRSGRSPCTWSVRKVLYFFAPEGPMDKIGFYYPNHFSHLVDKIGGAGEPHSRGFSNLKSGLKRAPSGEKRREEMLWAKSSLPKSSHV